jgi:hypothetical protein
VEQLVEGAAAPPVEVEQKMEEVEVLKELGWMACASQVGQGVSFQSVEAALSLMLKMLVVGRSRVHQSSANLQLMERMLVS